jgi:DNA primase
VVFQVRGVSENGSHLKPVILTHVGRALTLEQEKTEGKYWGYPFYRGLEIYNQDKLLLDSFARSQVEHFGLVLVEGFFDVAALVGSGLLNVGALMGAQMTDKQLTRLKFIGSRVTIPKITIFLDRDEAGIAGSEKALSLLRNNGISVDVFDWNHASEVQKDPGDISTSRLKCLRKEGKT